MKIFETSANAEMFIPRKGSPAGCGLLDAHRAACRSAYAAAAGDKPCDASAVSMANDPS